MKALVGAFNQEKALVGAFSVIVQPVVELMDRFAALISKHCMVTKVWSNIHPDKYHLKDVIRNVKCGQFFPPGLTPAPYWSRDVRVNAVFH